MKKLAFLIGVLLLSAGLWQNAEPIADAIAAEQIVMVSLVQPIEIQKSIQTGAKFQELTSEAMKYGMSDVVLNGRVSYSPQADSTTRSTIVWDSISMQSGGLTLSEPLGSPLQSMVRTQQPEQTALNRIEPGTSLKARGDVQTLAEALGRLKAQMDEKTKPITEKNEKVEKTNVAPVVAATQDQPQQTTAATTPFNTTIEAGTVTTSEKCSDVFIDYDKMKAVKQYKPVYTKAGVKTGEGVCSPNYAEATAILAKDGDCTYAFDFANSTAIKMEQWYYMDGSTEALLGTCRNSKTLYPLTESRLGCSVQYDMANSKAFPQSKMVFTVGANVMNATSCRPVDANGIALQEENCNPMWEHDFVNNVSYLKTRKFYISDVDGSKVYANECSRSSTISFSHVTDPTGCGWIMDDTKMLAYQQGKTIIKTGAIAGDVVVQECHTIATVNYTYIGQEKIVVKKAPGTGTWTVPAGVRSLSFAAAAGGGNAPPACISGGGGHGSAGQSTTQLNYTVTPGAVFSYNVGISNVLTTLQYDNGTNQVQWNLATSSDPYPYPKDQWGYTPSNYCTQDQTGRDGTKIPLGYFDVVSDADQPKGTKGGDAPCGLPGGAGGIGMAAGGGGGGSNSGCYNSGGPGAPGLFWIEYSVPKYMRPDGTSYYAPQN